MATASIDTTKGLFIGGAEVPSSSGKTFIDRDPATGDVLAVVASADARDVDAAVRSAADAFASIVWRRMKPAERGRILFRIAAALRVNAEALARLECLDTGKPLRQARGDAWLTHR